MELTGDLALIALAFALGGVLKGATGVGAPLFAVPMLALLYDVQTAVALFVMPNIVSNLYQVVQYRKNDHMPRFSWTFAGMGMVGALIGSFLLVALPGEVLLLGVAGAMLLYIVFRLSAPDWRLRPPWPRRLAAPMGAAAGILQGASGISAPVSITFLNAIRLERAQFIVTISLFFGAVGLIQLPALLWLGVMDVQRFVQSCAALLPLVGAMPLGAMIGRRLSPALFDKIILAVLGTLACKMIYDFFAM